MEVHPDLQVEPQAKTAIANDHIIYAFIPVV